MELPYGRSPLAIDLGTRAIEVLRAPVLPMARPVADLLDEALAAHPVRVAAGSRVMVIVSDSTRDEPREEFVAALRRHLPEVRWTIAVATGTHGPDPRAIAGVTVNHDGHDPRDVVELGVTARGTPMRVHRCVIEADLVIATGCIRPHYFAGFGAGAKAIFPGLGEATAIRINHRLKTAEGARAGIVDGNPCRADLEEAVRMVRTPIVLVNGVTSPDYAVRAVVVGDVERAFREGCEIARPWFTVRARRAPVVIASDGLPVTATLYQAAKIFAAVAPLVEVGGTIVVAAECPDGVGGVEVVNEAILRIGILPRLPSGVRIVLVSAMTRKVVAQTLVEYGESVESQIGQTNRVLVVPKASQLLCEVDG